MSDINWDTVKLTVNGAAIPISAILGGAVFVALAIVAIVVSAAAAQRQD